VDVQGFQFQRGPFIAKEVVVLDEEGATKAHHLFLPPLPYDHLSKEFQDHVQWCTFHLHDRCWGEGYTPYISMSAAVKESLEDARRIFVKGANKKKWLEEILDDFSVEIIDLTKAPKALRRNVLVENAIKLMSWSKEHVPEYWEK
jgi:hypothetical protein